MIRRPIRPIRFIAAAVMALWMAAPSTALAAANPDAAGAASAGLNYLAANQQANGSISGFGGESEWTAVAVAASGQDLSSFAHGGTSLLDFLKTDVPAAGTPATTIERKIIAISAAGQDPSSFGGVNYEALLATLHTSGQIGDPTLLNDDMFGIIAIDAAHDNALVPAAQDSLAYLLSHQGADGGFSYTTATCAYCGSDSSDTAAAIIAMYAADDLGLGSPSVDAARSSALTYLLSTQQADGGFGSDASSPSDGSSTGWDLMALNAIGSPAAASAAKARAWLMDNQNADGGFSYGAYGYTSSDTYTTSNAVIALLGTTWLLRPAVTGTSAASGARGGTASVTTTGGGTPAVTDSSQPAAQPADQPSAQTTAPTFQTTAYTAPAGGNKGNAKPAATPTANTGQVKAASTRTPSADLASRTAKHNNRYDIYFALLLGIIATAWFMLESRKTQGDRI